MRVMIEIAAEHGGAELSTAAVSKKIHPAVAELTIKLRAAGLRDIRTKIDVVEPASSEI